MNLLRHIGWIFLILGIVGCNSISTSRIRPTPVLSIVASIPTPTDSFTSVATAVPTATNTPTVMPSPTATATNMPTNTPTPTATATPTKSLFTPTPTLPPIPKGMGALIIENRYGLELGFDIASKLYKIPANSSLVISLSPGNHTYSGTLAGYAGRSGNVDIQENFYRVQIWGP